MIFRIGKSWTFSASHQLHQLPEGHKCRRMHGHTYTVEVVLEARGLDDHHMVRDFGELEAFGQWIKDRLDHRHLNDVVDEPPTCEVLARWIFATWHSRIPELAAIRVSESPTTWAEVAP